MEQDSHLCQLQQEVERLTKEAYQARCDGDTERAISLFKEALLKNKPIANLDNPPKCMGHTSAQFFIVGSLASLYEYAHRWEEAERLIEAYPSELPDEKRLAYLLIMQEKYADARVVLRKLGPLQEPVGTGCGNPMQNYLELKGMIETCEKKTPSLTEQDLLKLSGDWELHRAMLVKSVKK